MAEFQIESVDDAIGRASARTTAEQNPPVVADVDVKGRVPIIVGRTVGAVAVATFGYAPWEMVYKLVDGHVWLPSHFDLPPSAPVIFASRREPVSLANPPDPGQLHRSAIRESD